MNASTKAVPEKAKHISLILCPLIVIINRAARVVSAKAGLNGYAHC